VLTLRVPKPMSVPSRNVLQQDVRQAQLPLAQSQSNQSNQSNQSHQSPIAAVLEPVLRPAKTAHVASIALNPIARRALATHRAVNQKLVLKPNALQEVAKHPFALQLYLL